MTRARTGEEGSEGGGTIAPDGRRIIVVVIYVDARESKYYKRHYGRVSADYFGTTTFSLPYLPLLSLSL
jgi:hypothetical protein